MSAAAAGFPPVVTLELEGWQFFWADLWVEAGADDALAGLREEVTERLRERLELETLASHPAVAGLRKLFRQAGCDPTRYRSGSEALLRRLLKGAEMPAVHPLVDLGNCLAVELATNVCVLDADKLLPPLVFRAGNEGEEMLSLRGPFNCDGKPLLLDTVGPADVPITGADRVKVTGDTRRAWLIAYLPAGAVEPEEAHATLQKLLAAAPVASLLATGTTP